MLVAANGMVHGLKQRYADQEVQLKQAEGDVQHSKEELSR